jgi:broad specificity phosphatase PhoE
MLPPNFQPSGCLWWMMTDDSHIHLVRHGHVHNLEKVFYGRLPRFRLSAKGVEQARETARYIKDMPIAAVYSSPLMRARQTARELLGANRLQKVQISRLINEVYSPLQGRPSREVDILGARMYAGLAQPYETPRDIVNRATRFLNRVAGHYPGKQVVAVTHGDVILFSLLGALGKSLDAAYKGRMGFVGMRSGYPAHGSVTTLRIGTEAAAEKPFVGYWEAEPAN